MLDDAAVLTGAPSVGAGDGGDGSPTTPAAPTGEAEPIEGAPVEGADPPQPEGEQQAGAESDQPQGDEAGEDGRVLPKWIRSLKEGDPEGYKKAKTDFFDLRERRTDFPTVADARKAKQTLELVGGEAGLAEIQADNAEFTGISKDFLNGDPKFATDLFEQDPIAAAQHMPHMLEALQKIDGQAYNRLIAKQFAREFQAHAINGQTLFDSLKTVYGLMKEGKGEEALAGLNAIALWHNRITELSKQEENPEVKKLRDKIKADEQARTNEGQKAFLTSYRDEAQKAVKDGATQLVTQFLGTRKLDAESRNLAVNNTISLANDLLNDGKTFPNFAKQRDLLFQRGDKAALLRYVNSAWKQALDMSVKRVMRLVGGGGTAPAPKGQGTPPGKPGAGAPKSDPGFLKVNERPNPISIDRQKSPASMILNERRAVLKDGRKVTWAHL